MPITGDKPKEKDDCEPLPIGYHKGDIYNVWSPRYENTKRSNSIADKEPPNIYPGEDVKLKNITFDAQGPDRTFSQKGELWEVKAHNYENYSPENKTRAIKNIENSVIKQRPIAEACGFHYVLALTSEEEVRVIKGTYGDIDVRFFKLYGPGF